MELIGPSRVISDKFETSEVQGEHYKFELITFLFLEKEIYYFGITYVFVCMYVINYVYVCVCVCMLMSSGCLRGSSGTEVAGGCESPRVGAGN